MTDSRPVSADIGSGRQTASTPHSELGKNVPRALGQKDLVSQVA